MTQETKETTKEAEINWNELRPQLIKIALEIGPLLVFFFVNANYDIFTATAWFMGAMVVALALSWFLLHKVAIMPLVTGAVVLVFGTLTLLLKDDTFIKMKPTIVDSLFGVTLLGGLLFGQSLLKYVFGEVYKLRPEGWRVLTINWGLFFLFLAVANEVVWRLFDTNTWVAFKVWGVMPITVVFSMLQLPLLTKYAPDPEAPVDPIPPMDPLP